MWLGQPSLVFCKTNDLKGLMCLPYEIKITISPKTRPQNLVMIQYEIPSNK